MNADGTDLRRATDGIDPVLSPDGTQLAFPRWSSPAGVFVLDLRTGEERRVATVDRPRSPIWSPDGSKLALTHVTKSTECRATPFGCLSDDELRVALRRPGLPRHAVRPLLHRRFPDEPDGSDRHRPHRDRRPGLAGYCLRNRRPIVELAAPAGRDPVGARAVCRRSGQTDGRRNWCTMLI